MTEVCKLGRIDYRNRDLHCACGTALKAGGTLVSPQLLCCASHWSAITCLLSFLPGTVRGTYVKGCVLAAPRGELASDRYPEHTLSLIYPTSFIIYDCGALLWELGLQPDRWEHTSCAHKSSCRQRQGARQKQTSQAL